MQYLFWFAVFFMTWWVVLLAVLPWGVRTQQEDGNVVKGTTASAPTKFNIKKVFIINTIIAVFITLIVQQMVDNPNISTRAFLKSLGFQTERNF